MAKEFETLLNDFQALGKNYCSNFRGIFGKSEASCSATPVRHVRIGRSRRAPEPVSGNPAAGR